MNARAAEREARQKANDKRWKDALEPFASLYGEMMAAFAAKIEAMSDEELEALAIAATCPTQTNCWWATYRAAAIVREEVVVERQRRPPRLIVVERSPVPAAKLPRAKRPAKDRKPYKRRIPCAICGKRVKGIKAHMNCAHPEAI